MSVMDRNEIRHILTESPHQRGRTRQRIRKFGVYCFITACVVLCLVAQSCPILPDPADCSPPGSSVHGDSPGKNTRVGYHALLQGISPTQGSNPNLSHYRRILYQLSCPCIFACSVTSVVSDSVTPWTIAHQTPLSMGFSRQEYWSGLPCLSPGDLPDPRIKPESLKSPALAGSFFTTSATWPVSLGKSQNAMTLRILVPG